jgi:poly(hydroxyalkanoate) granule-associated protein
MWLAGLGALSVAEEAGTKVFNALVEEGKSWEEQRRKQQKQTAEQVKNLQEEGTRAVEAVEARVRDEVNDALRRIGVPHRDDIDELRHQVDALSEKMDRLTDAIAEQQDEEA